MRARPELLDDFKATVRELAVSIRWYDERRIKLTLDGMGPVEYRESPGLMAV